MRRLGVEIVGCGWVAGRQAADGFTPLSDQFQIVACFDTDRERARAFAAEHAIPATTGSFDELLARDEVDVVSICTPPSFHHPMVLEALAAGKHVICEKPFTSSLALTDEIVAAEARGPGRVMPIFQYRFGPGVSRIRRLIQSGLLGRAYISSIETSWRRGPDYYAVPWRGKFATELGGVLTTQAIHIHDLLLWLMGPAEAVAAFKATRVNPIEVEDCAVASVRMADGSLASLAATLGSTRPTTRIRLCFANATVERQCFDAEAPNPGGEPWSVFPADASLSAEFDRVMAGTETGNVGFAGQFELFHAALDTGAPFPVTLADARRSIELVTAIYHGSETGTTVTLPLQLDHPRYAGWVGPHTPTLSQ